MNLKYNIIYIIYENLQQTTEKLFAVWRKIWEHIEYK